jgi:hypothetical protein
MTHVKKSITLKKARKKMEKVFKKCRIFAKKIFAPKKRRETSCHPLSLPSLNCKAFPSIGNLVLCFAK